MITKGKMLCSFNKFSQLISPQKMHMVASLENLYIDLGAQWVNSAAKLLPF